jgi:hypothetical protein
MALARRRAAADDDRDLLRRDERRDDRERDLLLSARRPAGEVGDRKRPSFLRGMALARRRAATDDERAICSTSKINILFFQTIYQHDQKGTTRQQNKNVTPGDIGAR